MDKVMTVFCVGMMVFVMVAGVIIFAGLSSVDFYNSILGGM